MSFFFSGTDDDYYHNTDNFYCAETVTVVKHAFQLEDKG